MLIKFQGFDVTVVERGADSGFSTYSPDEVGIQGIMTTVHSTGISGNTSLRAELLLVATLSDPLIIVLGKATIFFFS